MGRVQVEMEGAQSERAKKNWTERGENDSADQEEK